jgi:RHS repeat-associated protein
LDQLVSLDNRNEGRSFFHLDILRSTVNLTNESGDTRQSILYDAWGNERDRIGVSANKFTFTGHELDDETGLIYARARFYDPQVGRFISQDSVLGDIAEPPSLHRYSYAGANPAKYIDPLGTFKLDVHMSVTIESIREQKDALGLSDKEYDALLRGAAEGSIFPDLQTRPLGGIPEGTPLETLEDVDKVVEMVTWPKRKYQEAVKIVQEKWADFEAQMIGLLWNEYPRMRKGLKNWWEHGPSFADDALKYGSKWIPEFEDLYETHYGELSWQHGMALPDEKAADVQEKLIQSVQDSMDRYKRHVQEGNYYEAGFELGKALHYLQDTHTPSHTRRDPKTGQIIAFYGYEAQSPKLHGEADKPKRSSRVTKKAIKQSQAMISHFQSGDSEGIEKLFEIDPEASTGRSGRYRSDEEQISPMELLDRAKQELEKHKQ